MDYRYNVNELVVVTTEGLPTSRIGTITGVVTGLTGAKIVDRNMYIVTFEDPINSDYPFTSLAVDEECLEALPDWQYEVYYGPIEVESSSYETATA